ncbi:MAG TPA: PAS domain S-box protein [Lutibacter sp.]
MLFDRNAPNNKMKERLKNLFSFNIAKRIALPFFIILLMMIVMISLTAKSFNTQINNYSFQREEASKQRAVANLRFSIATLIMHVHDYIITENVEDRQKFKLQRIQVEDYHKKLRTFELSEEDLGILNTIVADLDSVYLYSNRIFAIQHPGSSAEVTKLVEIIDANFEAPLYQNITKLFNISAYNIEKLTSQNTQIVKKMRNSRYIIFTLSLLLCLVIIYIAIQKISRPIRALTKAAEAITKGNYTLRPEVMSRDEIGILANSFSQMAQTVQETLNKLKESKEQYKYLFETTSDLIQTMTPDGKITFVNRAWSEKLGYSIEDLTNLKIGDIIQQDLFSKCDVAFQKALEGERTDNIEFKLIKQNGEVIDVEGNIFCNFKEGMPSTVACFLRDVTEQKRAENQLKFHANLLNEIDEAVIATNHNDNITYWNKAAEKLYGWNEAEVMGQNILDLIKPSVSKEEIALIVASLDNGESSSGEFICERKNGSTFPAIVYYSPILDAHNELTGIITISSDITKRRQSEEMVLKLSSTVEQSPISIFISDLNGVIEYVNPYIPKLTGYTYEELIGSNPNIFSSGVQSKAFYKELWNTILAGKKWEGEICNKKKNGKLFWEYVIISPLKNEKGEIINFINISEDITERKRNMAELVRAKEKAEESDKLKTAFINNISHEIRTPLNGILGFGQFWADAKLSESERKKYFSVVKQSSNRLMQTVSDYMDIAMIVSGTLEVHKKEFQIKPLLVEIVEYAKLLCETKPIDIEVEIPSNSELQRLESDRELIIKIIKNLIDNAVKFTEEGKITIGYHLLEGDLEFFIQDTGRGIKQDKLQTVFEAFTQEDTAMTRGYEGSGLGLAIAKGFVTSLNGDIWVTSKEGKGSIFYFTIPYNSNVLKAVNEKIFPPAINKPKGDNKPLVLVAEDDEINFLFIEALLELADCDYLHAINGKEAVEICKQDIDISFVLMDIKMPIMNGLEATKIIKGFRPNLPIIATTAYSLTGDEEKFLEAGFDGYYAKPIKKEILDKLIEKYISG